MYGRIPEKGYSLVSTEKITVTGTAQAVTLTPTGILGAEIHNAGEGTIFVAPFDADADSYELRANDRMYLAGVISIYSTEGSVLKIARVI